MNEKIWLSSPHMGGTEQKYVNEAFDTNWVAPKGPNLDAFEKELQQYLGEKYHVAALNSGTAAIHLALLLAGVQQGDEVLCQSFTFAATANPIVYLKALPVFIDSESSTWNLCPELLEEAIIDRISRGKKPKAMLIVDLYGMPAQMDAITSIAEKYHIVLIEDAAEALGSVFKGKVCGSFGDFGIFSFNGNKIITTSGGGALITKNKKIKEKAIYLASQACDTASHYEHSEIGYNYRMSNITAGIGQGQLEVLEDRIKRRRANFDYYHTELASESTIQFLEEPNGCFSNRWLTTIVLPSLEHREKIRLSLASENIESRPLWKPMHLQPVFKNYPNYCNGKSEKLFQTGLCVPSGSNLTERQLNNICRIIKNC